MVIVNVDVMDLEALAYNDVYWLADATDDDPVVVNIDSRNLYEPESMPGDEFRAYLTAARNAVLLPLSDNGHAVVEYVQDVYEREALRRVRVQQKRERLARTSEPSNWASADLVAEIEAVCGEGRQAGREFFFSCPWHADSTPSLHVNPETKQWHCFACQRGGGVVDWRRARRL